MRVIYHSFSALVVLVVLSYATTSTARTWYIDPDGSGDAPTIQAAIDSCTNGDIVELASGTYMSDGNRDVDFFGKQITVRGATGDAADCVMDCQGSEAENHRGFIFQAGETSESRLESLTITNGYLDSPNPFPDDCGGGIQVWNGSSPTLENLTLRANRAPAGGGMFIMDSEVNVSDCKFLDNQAPWGGGGGISAHNWNPSEPISDCLFQGNSTHQAGGGLACGSSDLVFRRCQFLENTLDDSGFGGGFFAYLSTICEFEDCTFARNSFLGYGAAFRSGTVRPSSAAAPSSRTRRGVMAAESTSRAPLPWRSGTASSHPATWRRSPAIPGAI